jgi:purine-binding chemotaxis protein CheW
MDDEIREVYVVMVRARTWLCALAVECVIETMRPLPIEALVGVPSFVLGMAIIRGSVTPVISLDVLLGARTPAEPKRFVLVRAGSERIALAVDSVRGTEKIAVSRLGVAPPLLSEVLPTDAARVGALDQTVLVMLETGRLINDETWRAISAEVAGS